MKLGCLAFSVSCMVFSMASIASANNDPFTNLVVEKTDQVCGLTIAKAVFKKATKRYGRDNADTMNISLVTSIGTFDPDSLVTPYKVSVSDEVGESEWIVVAETEDCVIEYVGILWEH